MSWKLVFAFQAALWHYSSASFCPEIKPMKYGSFKTEDIPPYKHGAKITIKCDRGYKGHGKKKIICENGRWSDPVPYCAAILCRKNLTKVGNNRKCRKSCRSDIDCKGSFKKCICDGWCGKTCFNPDADCPELLQPKDGYILSNKRSYGHTVTYGCNVGYMLRGRATRVCQANRKWSGYEPNCAAFSACGQSGDDYEQKEEAIKGKVSSGKGARKGAWPWQAHLFYNRNHNANQIYSIREFFAGGSIIDDQWILTAAHVFEQNWNIDRKSNPQIHFLIAVGLTTLPEQHEAIPGYVNIFEPKTVYIHRQYDIPSYDYDVALVKIGKLLKRKEGRFISDPNFNAEKFIFSPYVRPVCLPCMNENQLRGVDIRRDFNHSKCDSQRRSTLPMDVKPGDLVTVTGLGYSIFNEMGQGIFRNNTLQQGLLRIAEDAKCIEVVKTIRAYDDDARYSDTMLCTESALTDACQGDSGGPLVKQMDMAKGYSYWLLVGITSWGWQCGKYPGFFTSVTSTMHWVWQTIDDDSKASNLCGGRVCPQFSSCFNQVCQCNTGYKLAGGSCNAVAALEPCLSNAQCGQFARCVARGGIGHCVCIDGYHTEGKGQCVVNDPCYGVTCPPFSTCVPQGGRGFCQCQAGYRHAGSRCVGKLQCNEMECEFWTGWTEWSQCSVTCKFGIQIRTRECQFGSPGMLGCIGESVETRQCFLGDGEWTPWSDFTPCSKSCKGGEMIRFRTHNCDLPDQVDVHGCNTDIGSYGQWSQWSICSATCGGGFHTRRRSHSCGEPDEVVTKACNTDEEWSGWTACTTTGGDGTRTRTRRHSCNKSTEVERQKCNTRPDAFWSYWSKFGPCSVSCGEGISTRSRVCIEGEPGEPFCFGPEQQVYLCDAGRFHFLF